MDLSDFESNLQKLDAEYELGAPSTLEELAIIEKNLNVTFPEQVKNYYQNIGALKVISPALEIYDISNLKKIDNRIAFCKFSNEHELSFDISKINSAKQWNIINRRTNYQVTKTMASFYSNKIWAWLRNNREIWTHEIHT